MVNKCDGLFMKCLYCNEPFDNLDLLRLHENKCGDE